MTLCNYSKRKKTWKCHTVHHDTQVTIQYIYMYVYLGLSCSIQLFYPVSLHLYKLPCPWHLVINVLHCYTIYYIKIIYTLITKFSNMYQHCNLCVVYFQMVEILQLLNNLTIIITLTGALQHWRYQWLWNELKNKHFNLIIYWDLNLFTVEN